MGMLILFAVAGMFGNTAVIGGAPGHEDQNGADWRDESINSAFEEREEARGGYGSGVCPRFETEDWDRDDEGGICPRFSTDDWNDENERGEFGRGSGFGHHGGHGPRW